MGLATGFLYAKHISWPAVLIGQGIDPPEDAGFWEEAGWTVGYVVSGSGILTGQGLALGMGYTGPPPMQFATLMFDSAWLGMKIGEATKDTGMAEWFRQTELAESIRSLPF